jgi:cysteine desulfurase/selenocysteine lyase
VTYHEGMTVRAPQALDVERLREDFAVFDELLNGKPIAYLDSASSTQKPRQVLDRMRHFYEHEYANVHRGVYTLAERATEGFENARRTVAAFLNAPSERELVFTRSATEALNLVAYTWGLEHLGPGDVVVVTELEHHANFVPWQWVASRTGASFRHIPIDDTGELRLEVLEDIALDGNVKVVATGLVSNSLGTINPVRELADWAHAQGGIMVVDAAQAAPHRRVDVQELDCDFCAISSHKLCGPTGVGALWGRARLLEAMPPFNFGGEMIRSVALERTTFNDIPHKFEAGTPAIAEAVGFGAAVDYISEIGLAAIEQHEHELTRYAVDRLGELDFVTLYGPPVARRAGIVSFTFEGVHPHDVAQVLDWEGVAVRAGHHCTQPLMTRLGVGATTRASFYLYSLQDDVDRLVEGLQTVRRRFA